MISEYAGIFRENDLNLRKEPSVRGCWMSPIVILPLSFMSIKTWFLSGTLPSRVWEVVSKESPQQLLPSVYMHVPPPIKAGAYFPSPWIWAELVTCCDRSSPCHDPAFSESLHLRLAVWQGGLFQDGTTFSTIIGKFLTWLDAISISCS